jgi:hypothetical protein
MRQVDGRAPEERAAAIEQYVAANGGTPLIENQSRLIFLVQSATGSHRVWSATSTPGPIPPERGTTPRSGDMTPIEGTDWWWLQSEAYTNARLEYVLLYDRETAPDPHNPRTIDSIVGERSEIRMPFWSPNPEIDDDAPQPAGELIDETRAVLGR